MNLRKYRSVLNWVLPAWLAGKAKAIPPNELEEAIAKASEHDKCFRALLQLAGEQWEQDNFEALNEKLTSEQRHYAAGRAAAMMDYLIHIQRVRELARQADASRTS